MISALRENNTLKSENQDPFVVKLVLYENKRVL